MPFSGRVSASAADSTTAANSPPRTRLNAPQISVVLTGYAVAKNRRLGDKTAPIGTTKADASTRYDDRTRSAHSTHSRSCSSRRSDSHAVHAVAIDSDK